LADISEDQDSVSAETRKGRVPETAAAPGFISGLPAAGLSAAGSIVRRHDRDRYQTALFAPFDRREALFALYAFNYEVARVRESVTQPMLGQIRLQWWREVIEAAYAGAPVRRHEVVQPLVAAIGEFGLSRAHFERIIDTRERDLADTPPPDLAALEDYVEGTSATLVLLALEILDVRTEAAEAAGHEVGIAYALAGVIRAIPVRARAGRSYLPADLVAKAGLDPHDYPGMRASPAMRRIVEALAETAAGHLTAARRHRSAMPRQALPALLPGIVADRALRRIRRAGWNPFDPALARPDPLLIWRLLHAALRRRF
jgi:NADH dehydrogenase [ubiquinone] 1 alpha subcomplex assembly factor 6